MGADLTRQFAQSREQDATKNPLTNQMDMHNNEIGISIGLQILKNLNKPIPVEDLPDIHNSVIEQVRNAFNNGLLWYFNTTGTQLIPTNK